MICTRCAHAADQQLGQEEHCDAQGGPDSACDCQHRTDRYMQTSTVIYVDASPLIAALHRAEMR